LTNWEIWEGTLISNRETIDRLNAMAAAQLAMMPQMVGSPIRQADAIAYLQPTPRYTEPLYLRLLRWIEAKL
jgi:hypothetical protein